jgi:hypothetical protein
MYKEKALAMSDVDATNLQLEQSIIESSLGSYRRLEHGQKQRATPTAHRRRPRNNSPPPTLAAFATASAPLPDFASMPPAAASAAASAPPAAAAAALGSTYASPRLYSDTDEHPQCVEELVMNGFELSKVLHAYDLIGDNFDDLLAFLMSTVT